VSYAYPAVPGDDRADLATALGAVEVPPGPGECGKGRNRDIVFENLRRRTRGATAPVEDDILGARLEGKVDILLDVLCGEFEADRDAAGSVPHFIAHLPLSNPGAARDVDLYVVLDVFQDYYFYPSWSHYPDEGIDKASLSLPGARVTRHDILAFTWPPNAGSASGIKFWGAMLDPATAELLGEIVYVSGASCEPARLPARPSETTRRPRIAGEPGVRAAACRFPSADCRRRSPGKRTDPGESNTPACQAISACVPTPVSGPEDGRRGSNRWTAGARAPGNRGAAGWRLG